MKRSNLLKNIWQSVSPASDFSTTNRCAEHQHTKETDLPPRNTQSPVSVLDGLFQKYHSLDPSSEIKSCSSPCP